MRTPARELPVEGPFFNLAAAAEYCDYAPGTFERVVREFKIPRHGPKRNRYAKSILDLWMAHPDLFKENPLPARRGGPILVR